MGVYDALRLSADNVASARVFRDVEKSVASGCRRKTLAACGGNRAEAARRLNIHRQLLYTKMERYALTDEDVSANPTQTVGKSDS